VLLAAVGAGAGAVVSLRDPPRRGGRTLLECLWARHSTRRFAPDPLPEGALARILWSADGVNRADAGKRTAPSAFECYPVTLYVVEKTRAFRYEPMARRLVPVRQASADTKDLRTAVTGPSSFAVAPVVLVFVADCSVFPDRAGEVMRGPWAHAECGAIGQNVYLACADLDLGTVFAAVMKPEPVRALLSLGPGAEPLYMMPVGRPQALKDRKASS
jgi:nitroreductase